MNRAGMTEKNLEFQHVSNRLSPGTHVALLPNRALQLPALANATNRLDESATPGLRGLLRALGAPRSPAELRAQTLASGAGHAAPPGHYFVALELCYWQIEMGGARWMAHGEGLNLSAAERMGIAAALAGLFASADAQLISHLGGEFSLMCEAATPAVQAAFPDEALGCELKSMLPTPNVWQRYLNEAQMLLANLPVNRVRAARGEPVVNSVWFWGAEVVASDFAPLSMTYFGDDPILQSLSSPTSADAIQIYDYRALFGAELAAVIEKLPAAAKLWLNDGRVFQARARPGFLRRIWQGIAAKVQGARS